MQTFKNVFLAALLPRLLPASAHHLPQIPGGGSADGPGRWDNFFCRTDAAGGKAPLLFKVERPLVLAPEVPVSVGVDFQRGKEVPGVERQSRDMIYLRVRPRLPEAEACPPLELAWVEWGPNEDGVWVRRPGGFDFRWFGDGCRGVLLLSPPGETPRITIVPERKEVLWEGPAVVRLPANVPENCRRANYNGVKYSFATTDGTIEIYDGRRNAFSPWGKVTHVRKTLPDLRRGGTRQFEYFTVEDDVSIQPATVRHLLTEEGLKEVV
jgi:hypothetical protein